MMWNGAQNTIYTGKKNLLSKWGRVTRQVIQEDFGFVKRFEFRVKIAIWESIQKCMMKLQSKVSSPFWMIFDV